MLTVVWLLCVGDACADGHDIRCQSRAAVVAFSPSCALKTWNPFVRLTTSALQAMVLLYAHNLHQMMSFMGAIQEALLDGTFDALEAAYRQSGDAAKASK